MPLPKNLSTFIKNPKQLASSSLLLVAFVLLQEDDTLSAVLLVFAAVFASSLVHTHFLSKIGVRLPKWMRAAVVFLLVISSIALATSTEYLLTPQDIQQETATQEQFLVSSVTDGDTIKVLIDGEIQTVRVVNINTPETVHPQKPVECMGKEASQAMRELVEGKVVRLETDATQAEKDRYGRLLRYVFLEDGTDVGLKLVALGFAHSQPYGSPPHKYFEHYSQAQAAAQEQEVGLWNPNVCK